jgi:signal transduction histidine kinase
MAGESTESTAAPADIRDQILAELSSAPKDESPVEAKPEPVSTAQRQVDYHLARPRAAAAIQVPGLRTPVIPVIESLVRVMKRVHAERSLEILIEPGADGQAEPAFRGEEQDLQEMLGNLIDNACKWARERVDCRVSLDRSRLVIRIDDDGPGLPAAEREAVFGRGVRADEQTPGSGLGLAIVRDLARLYGGDVALDASPAGGLRVALTLPAA